MTPKQNYPTGHDVLPGYLLMLRSRAKLTQLALANRLGVHRRSVQKWESQEAYPTAENLRALITLLLNVRAFTPGQERAEAATLWQSASQPGAQHIEFFDPVWFEQLLAVHTATGQIGAQATTTPALMDTVTLLDERPQEWLPASHPQHHRQPLPFQPTPLIGRNAELSEIISLLGNPACRLLTLLGPGGIGKTRLALAIAQQQIDAFAADVVFVPLAAVGASNQIVLAIGEALNLTFTGQRDPRAYLLDYLRAQQLLLVLDNFEHLLDGVDLVYAILTHAPQLTLVITSRERLNLQAEWLFNVEGLAYPQADLSAWRSMDDLPPFAEYSAVQLFMQRIAQLQSGLTPPAAMLPVIGRICQQLAGMPLALELAAASVRLLSLPEIERQLHTNLDLLATTLHDVPARHRSLRAVFDQSWRLLNELEQALFSRLAIFRGRWTIAAAEQITGATLPVLAALVDKSLIYTVMQTGAGLNAAAEPHFSMLAPIQEYALEQLALRGEVEPLQRAHAAYYLNLAEMAADHWDHPTANTIIRQLDREYDNLRAVLQWARDGRDQKLGLQLGGALRKYWQRRGLYNEGRAWLAELLALTAHATDPAVLAARARALNVAAWLASDQHDFTQAALLFEQSLALQQSLGQTDSEANLLTSAARQARAAGHYLRATALLEDALARHRALGDRQGIGTGGLGLSLYELGLVRREQGDFGRAMALFEECIEFHRTLGDREGITIGQMGLGDLARDQGDSAGVRKYCEQGLADARELGLQWAIGFLLNNLALAALMDGKLTQALALVNDSLSLFHTLRSEASIAEVLITQGQILGEQGKWRPAYAALAEALRLAWSLGPRLIVAAALEGLASVLARANSSHQDVVQAVRLLSTAAALREQMGAPLRPADQAASRRALAASHTTLGDPDFATVWAEARKLPLEQIISTIRGDL